MTTILLLEDTQNPKYVFKTPMLVYVEPISTDFIVSDELAHIYGVDITQEWAVFDYLESLISFFEWLTRNEQTLAADLPAKLYFLRHKLGLVE